VCGTWAACRTGNRGSVRGRTIPTLTAAGWSWWPDSDHAHLWSRAAVVCGSSGPDTASATRRTGAMSAVAAARPPRVHICAGGQEATGHPSGAAGRRGHQHGHRLQPGHVYRTPPVRTATVRTATVRTAVVSGNSGRSIRRLLTAARSDSLQLPLPLTQGRPPGNRPHPSSRDSRSSLEQTPNWDVTGSGLYVTSRYNYGWSLPVDGPNSELPGLEFPSVKRGRSAMPCARS
jgi:hypothetical protein